jgi:flagellar biogenesis protein FliO
MATIINNPSDNSGGSGILIGIIIAILFMVIIFIYGFPLLMRNRGAQPTTVNVQLPVTTPTKTQ